MGVPVTGSFFKSVLPWILLAISGVLNAYLASTRQTVTLGAESQSHEIAVAAAQQNVSEGISTAAAVDLHSSAGVLLTGVGHPSKIQSPLGVSTARRLADSHSDSTTDDHATDDHSEGGHHAHQHDALIYMFLALFLGVVIMNLRAHFTWMQETVCYFVVGMFFSFIVEWAKVRSNHSKFAESYYMWMGIDPHLLLFTLLPPLLAGDAMSIDTSVAQHVAFQCLYMAGPGVLVNAFTVGGFLCWYLEWEVLLSLVTGAILCATDPVAVVALLKELGASPTLTVQIQGESLLNDGTAIVLFTVCYNMLSGEKYDAADVVMFLVQVALMAWALGMFIGYFFFSWIRATGNIFNHHCSIIQISLTLMAAYWSFIVAEGLLKISGVLSTVACSLVLAHNMWPHVVNPETMHHVWHTFETLGNVIIFILAGSLTGKVMVETPGEEWIRLLVVYVVLVLVRTCFIFASRPLLQKLSLHSIPVSRADAVVMSWGGLRGAVGLALAIQVYNDRAPDDDDIPQISEDTARQVYFLVGGVALLTTIINATTAPILVKWLGITALPASQLRLLKIFFQHLILASNDKSHPPEITEGLAHMLDEMEKEIDHQSSVHRKPTQQVLPGPDSPGLPAKSGSQCSEETVHTPVELMEESASIVKKLRRGEEMYQKILAKNTNSMLWVSNTGGSVSKGIPEKNMLGDVEGMIALVCNSPINESMSKVVNRAFLNVVNTHYWKQIECRDLRPGSEEAKILLTSIQVALSSLTIDLRDFPFVIRRLRKVSDEEGHWWQVFPEAEEAQQMQRSSSSARVADADNLEGIQARQQACLGRMVASAPFSIVMALAIVANCVYVLVEDEARTSDNSDHLIWLIIEASFTSLWLFEFLLKFWVMRWTYFHSSASVFDFVLVVLGLFGLVVSVLEHSSGETSEVADLAGVMRISRVFRVLRFLRIFRLFHARLSADKAVSVELANHMLRIDTLSSFIAAHLSSQQALIKYFGGNGAIDTAEEAEIARCIVQSQVYVYQAIQMAFEEEKKLSDEDLLQDLKWTYERKEITESLEEFVIAAYKDGAISAREAESIVHPLHHQIVECLRKLNDSAEGIKRSKVEPDRYLQGKNAQSTPVNSRSQIVRRASVARGNVTMDENGEVIVLDPVPPPAAEKPQVMCMETEVHDSAHESTPDTSGDVIPVEAAHLRSNSSQEESSLSPPVLIGEPLN
mmetsp:Transcript_13270/g.31049  ORF Transcript_13270/g.31049 Transcript_13270/m.31049 type:complete len:1203 (-) Transcript_13270:191-3799(-)